MDVYIYRAALHCADCGKSIRAKLTCKRLAPKDPDDE